jgi:hypothetical protein
MFLQVWAWRTSETDGITARIFMVSAMSFAGRVPNATVTSSVSGLSPA